MSVSKWAYIPEKCDGEPCPGDCDICEKTDDNLEEIEKAHEKGISVQDVIALINYEEGR